MSAAVLEAFGLKCKTQRLVFRMDEDLKGRSREELIAMVVELRAGIRRHRDCEGHDLCWFQPELWKLVDPTMPLPKVPTLPDFIYNCVKYRMTLPDDSKNQ